MLRFGKLSWAFVWVAIVCIAIEQNASAEITNYAVFGGNGVTLTGKDIVGGGLVGSNGSVAVGTFSQFSAGIK